MTVDANAPDPEYLLAEFRAFERSLALRAAIELDLFTKIDSGVNTVSAIASGAGASQRGIRILCDYLTVVGHLSKESDAYRLPLNSKLYLSAASPAYIGSAVRFLASDGNLHSFGQLAEAIRSGGAPSRAQTIPDIPTWIGFAHFMSGMAKPIAEAAAAALGLKSNRSMRVLDIAAGSGVYGLAVADRARRAEIFALDAPEVLEIAAANARLAGVAERYHVIPGDAFHVDFGGPYDLIVMSNFAHHFDVATNVALFQKCRAALASSGRLALIDFVPNEDRVSPPPDAAFALTMLATTASGDAYTLREFSRMLKEAGFRKISRPDLGDAPQWLIVAG